MYQTTFNPKLVDTREMETLIDWLQRKTGAKLNVQSVILVETDSAEVSNMLDALRDSMKNGKTPKVTKPATTRKPKAQKVSASSEAMGRASRKIESTGEVLSLRELKKRIADGAIPQQTIVINHKHERFVVVGGDLIKEPGA